MLLVEFYTHCEVCPNIMSPHMTLLFVIAIILPGISVITAIPLAPVASLQGFHTSALNVSIGEEWDTWEAQESIRKAFTYYRSGYDYDGLVVYVFEVGNANYKDLALRPTEYIEEFWKFYEQFFQRMEFDAARNNNDGIAMLLDWDGFSLQNFASSDALQIALKMFTSLARMNNAIRYGININVNFVAQAFINMGKPFFGNMLDKFEFYGTRSGIWMPKLRLKIPAEQLAPKYGGDKNWKPLPERVTLH